MITKPYHFVDIAMKALSPGINDTTTAVMCVDYLAAILLSHPKSMAYSTIWASWSGRWAAGSW